MSLKRHPIKYKLTLLATLSTIYTVAFATELDETRSTLNDQKNVAVTIYNGDLALVKDTRQVKLKTGLNALALRDVSAQIRPETALLRSINVPGSLTLLEQNFDFDLLTPQKLLEKYVGKSVSVVKTHPTTGVETTEKATVLSANNGIVLQIGNRIETGIPGRIVYDDVPENLRDRPTLVTQISNKGATDQTVELSYLTGGLGWKADYVAELSPKEDSIDLSGWVTLTNTSGASYKNAKLQLVAGDVNRIQPQQIFPMAKSMRGDVRMDEAAAPMAEESLLEYHLYTLDRPTTIAENQTKQVALLSASNVPARKELVLRGADYYYQSRYGDLGTKMKVGVFVEFENKEASKLGMPLPKGILRVYKKDNSGNAQFIGEDSIDHTSKNEVVRLKLGESFDVTADKKQTNFKVLPNPQKGHNAYESTYEIVLKNAKKEKMTVIVQEPISGDWSITSESQPHKKVNSQLAVWKVEIPAESNVTLSYKAVVKY
ncbi:MAG: DUF4139 domain-containing protein [Methylotenera sp.]|uniref:DUF4139 domain-containing protein n=1 Tax=Methylotenera sp. TaxID=2051956 RepID=UPI00248717F4|nr:DUF4139 domain-containing protein [Methylotenera sp.]MDI1309374.1 DUF4139 domain-containing protein [Methylotenera sp.]